MIEKQINHPRIIISLTLLIFLGAAILGWINLQYGFNFIDEGYHMTESWRLTAGDTFLTNGTSTISLYTLINSCVFKLWPTITLLNFRKLQFCLTIFALFLMGGALYKTTNQFWFLPIVFSVFAFTGLDPTGMISNMNYYTYPHFFLTMYAAFFIFGLYAKNPLAKRLLYIASGLSLWGISLSLLQLSVVILSPILIFLLSRKQKILSVSFTFSDLCYV